MSKKSIHEQVKLFYKLAVYGDRADFLNRIGQMLPSATRPAGGVDLNPTLAPKQLQPELQGGKWVNPSDNAPAPQVQTLPEEKIVGYPPIPTETQDQLNKLLVPSGKIMPLALDGKLGPETAKAVKLFKDTYKKPATVQSIKDTYLAEAHPEIETQFPG